MKSNADRAKKTIESAISSCLLAILVLIGVGIFIKQFDVDMSRFGMDMAAIPKFEIQNSKPETPFDPGTILPSGFEKLSGIEIYSAENLYEKINGKAPLYIESGFEKLFTQRFVSEKDRENLWMELYLFDMGTTKNAFSVYSIQKRSDARILPDMGFAYRTSNALYFTQDRYYVELIGSSESTELSKAMVEVVRKIKLNLVVGNVAEIAELILFPKEGMVPDSTRLYLINAFGFEGLTNTFTVRYKFDDEDVTAFLSRCDNAKNAKSVAESYYNFLISNGGIARQVFSEAIKGEVVEFYDTIEIVFTAGPFVAGIHEAEKQQSAENLALMLIDKLNEAVKTKDDD